MIKLNRRTPLCACGCEERVTWNKYKKCWNRFVIGHKIYTEEQKQNHSIKTKLLWEDKEYYDNHQQAILKAMTEDVCNRISKSLTGRVLSKEHIENMSQPRTEEAKKNNSKSKIKLWENLEYYNKMVKIHTGHKQSKETIEKKSGANHPNWQGGKSFEIYPQQFTNKLKDQIRQRDNYICQLCLKPQEKLKDFFIKLLDVHHIDYDKKNCNSDNLISLCHGCHTRTTNTKDREGWQSAFVIQ